MIILLITHAVAIFAAFMVGQELGRKRERQFIAHAKAKIDRLHKGWPVCDACQRPITDEQKDIGHDCHLHEWCQSND